MNNGTSEPHRPSYHRWLPDGLTASHLYLLAVIILSSALILLLWRKRFVAPLKILAVLLHECCHLLAGLLTCGTIVSIQIDSQEGGETRFKGGVALIITPAGYLGSSLIGAIFLVSGARVILALISSCAVVLVVALAFWWASSCLTRSMALLFASLVAGLWALHFTVDSRAVGLRTCMLFLGSLNGLYSIADIWTDSVAHRSRQSDVELCVDLMGCGSTPCVGALWAMLAFLILLCATYMSLLLVKPFW